MFMPTKVIGPTLRAFGARIGADVRFRSPIVIHNSRAERGHYYDNLQVGEHCLGRELFLDLQDQIVIEDHVTISHRVMILTHTDAGASPLADQRIRASQSPVIVRRGAYIGANVTILEGIEIGESSIVGAGASCNSDQFRPALSSRVCRRGSLRILEASLLKSGGCGQAND